MKLTGSLANIPFDEILLLLMQRSGTITIWDLPDNQGLQLHIDNGKLRAFFVNYRALKNETQILQWVAQLLDMQMGIFSFDPKSLDLLEDILNVDINKLLLGAAVVLDQARQDTHNNGKVKPAAQPENYRRDELIERVNEFRRSFSGVQGIAISAQAQPLRFGNVKQIADLVTIRDTGSTQRNLVSSPHGDIAEMIIYTPNDVLMAYHFEAQKALFAVKYLEDPLQHQIRNLVLSIVEFWVEDTKIKRHH